MKKRYGYCRVYRLTDEKLVKDGFIEKGCNEILFDDSMRPKEGDSKWNLFKEKILVDKASLIVDSLESLGKTGREVFKELIWCKDNKVSLFVLSIPSSFSNNEATMTALMELYEDKSEKERLRVAEGRQMGQKKAKLNNTPNGRPLTPYPDKWDIYYEKWQAGEITAARFMDITRIKKGTFYNLVKRYKAEKLNSINKRGLA